MPGKRLRRDEATVDGDEATRSAPGQDGRAGQPNLRDVVDRLSRGYKSIGEMVYEVIRESIVSGAFAPGEYLRQEALATAIGVSRIPVRSALIQLDSEGLVVFHPRRGAVVRSLTDDQLRETYELRELLEPYALRKSMKTMTPERLATLRSLATRLDAEHSGPGFIDLRVEFYRELYDARHHPQLVELIEGLRSSVGRYLLAWRVSEIRPGHGTHAELIEFVATKNRSQAEKWLRAHLEEVRRGIERILADGQQAPTPPGDSTTARRRRGPTAS